MKTLQMKYNKVADLIIHQGILKAYRFNKTTNTTVKTRVKDTLDQLQKTPSIIMGKRSHIGQWSPNDKSRKQDVTLTVTSQVLEVVPVDPCSHLAIKYVYERQGQSMGVSKISRLI